MAKIKIIVNIPSIEGYWSPVWADIRHQSAIRNTNMVDYLESIYGKGSIGSYNSQYIEFRCEDAAIAFKLKYG